MSVESSALPGTEQHARRVAMIIGALTITTPFATDMYLSSFPTLALEFHTGAAQVQSTLSAFVLGLAMGQLLLGPTSDRFGRRGPLFVGFALFTLTSALIPWAPNIQVLVALRFLQAIGACSGGAVGRAVLRDVFSGQDVARAISVQMMIQSAGPILAPLVGAYVFSLAGWRANFYLQTVFGVMALMLIARALPETLPPSQRRSAHPLATLKTFGELLQEWEFVLPMICSAAAAAALFCYLGSSPYVLLEAYHVSVREYGWIFVLIACASVTATQTNRLLVRRYSAASILAWVLPLAALAGLLLVAAVSLGHLFFLLPPLWLFMACVPLTMANGTALAMQPAGGRAGTASSLIGVLQWLAASVISLVPVSLHNGTAYPMGISMTLCACIACAAFLGYRARAVRT